MNSIIKNIKHHETKDKEHDEDMDKQLSVLMEEDDNKYPEKNTKKVCILPIDG